MSFSWLFMRLNPKIRAFVVITVPYLRFSYHFRPRGESATFWLATMDAHGPMRCTWSDATYATHMVRCDAYGSMLFKFVQKGSVCKPMRCEVQKYQFDYKSMRCDAHGPMRCIWSDAVLVCTKKIRLITNRCDAMHMVRCDAVHMVRCDAHGPTLFLFVQKRSV